MLEQFLKRTAVLREKGDPDACAYMRNLFSGRVIDITDIFKKSGNALPDDLRINAVRKKDDKLIPAQPSNNIR